uniref:Transcription factor HMG20 n=1 Tax=Phallusia mammillata TaxID=59560 RepID=A0A6F9DDW8_9ASCI|nr:transcription factor HMG20 [Phallusia mammillata]
MSQTDDLIGDDMEGSKKTWPRNKRKKTMKDENAPKKPLNGYVLFMNARRESITKQNPNMQFADITKLLGEEWGSMNEKQRSFYLDSAEKERERYKKKMEEYKKTDSYKKFLEKKGDVKQQPQDLIDKSVEEKRNVTTSVEASHKKHSESNIPIFTEHFLDYNKARESELHQLNKANMAYEKQNIVLDKHVANLKNAVEKLNQEIEEQNLKNFELEKKLTGFRSLLLDAFSEIRIPASGMLPTAENIDTYIAEACEMLQGNIDDRSYVTAVQDVMTKVNFQTLEVSQDEHDD